jgi:hypothetical protein
MLPTGRMPAEVAYHDCGVNEDAGEDEERGVGLRWRQELLEGKR